MGPTTLFCLPYAGGNAYAYRSLAAHLPAEVTLEGIELPGRGRRTREPLLRSLEALADDVFEQLRSRIAQGPYAFFGHSMGARLVYLCLQRLREAGLPLPRVAILSGSRAPSVERTTTRHRLPRAEFKAMLTTLGGCPPEVLADDAFFAYFESILRADFEAVETWRHVPQPRLPVDLLVLRGRGDEVTHEEAAAWARETAGGFELLEFDGHHFFIESHWPAIASVVAMRLAGPAA